MRATSGVPWSGASARNVEDLYQRGMRHATEKPLKTRLSAGSGQAQCRSHFVDGLLAVDDTRIGKERLRPAFGTLVVRPPKQSPSALQVEIHFANVDDALLQTSKQRIVVYLPV